MAENEPLPVSRAKAGEGEAWNELFRRFQMPLYVYVFEMVREKQASLDIIQETFVTAMRHIGGLQEEGKFGSWLFSIAHQKCIQLWRKTKREQSAVEEIAEAPMEFEDDPRERLVRREEEERFLAVVEKLPLAQRSAIMLYFAEEFSIEQIAEITGVSVGTVKSRLHYGKKALRAFLGERVV